MLDPFPLLTSLQDVGFVSFSKDEHIFPFKKKKIIMNCEFKRFIHSNYYHRWSLNCPMFGQWEPLLVDF